MKKFNVGLALLVVAVCALFFNPVNAYADTVTLTLESVGGQSSGGEYVYPYNFSIDGSSTITQLMCLSFNQNVHVGESWKAIVEPVLGNTEYEEAAYIFSLAAAPGASANTIAEAQWANWVLFDPGAYSSVPLQYRGDVTNLLNAAAAVAHNNPNSSLYSNLEVFIPVAGSQPQGDCTPQIMIGDTAPTPEPGSLLMLGTGMLGLATFLYRRKSIA
jgi:hypothetical protein